MGLFRVNMPLLYGEGENAFLRLQSEILKVSDDESIFAWWTSWWTPEPSIVTEHDSKHISNKTRTYDPLSGLLAASPADFRFSADVRPFSFDDDRRPYSLTNRGVQMQPLKIQLRQWSSAQQRFLDYDGQIHTINFPRWEQPRLYAIELNCYVDVRSTGDVRSTSDFLPDEGNAWTVRRRPLLIILRKIADGKNTYGRTLTDARSMVSPPMSAQGTPTHGERSLIYVRPVP